MNLSEKIAQSQEALTTKKDALLAVLAELDETPDDDTLLDQFEDLTEQVEKETKRLDMLKKAEDACKERVKTKEDLPTIITGQGKKEDAKELWLKKAVCCYLAEVKRTTPEQIMAERYKNNRALETVMFQKTAVPLATTYDAGWAAELAQTDVQGFIDILTPLSVTAAIASRTMALEFGGFDSITVPRRNPRTAGTTLGGAFVGEGGAIPLGRISVGAQSLARYKHGVISTFSRELAERSTPAIEAILRQAILDDMSISLDSVFLGSAAAVAGIQPAGIGNGVTPVAGTAGGGIDAVVADIKAAKKALTTAGVGVKPVLIMNENDADSVSFMQTALGEFKFAGDLENGRLLRMDVIVSLNCPEGTFYLVDANAIATGFDPVSFESSTMATVVEANADVTAPTHADDGAGAIGTAEQVPRKGGIPVVGASGAASAGYTARSLFQTNSVAIKAWQPVAWGAMQDGAVYICDNLTW